MSEPLILPDEPVRAGVAPPAHDGGALDFSPPPDVPHAMPPIFLGEPDEDAPLAERIGQAGTLGKQGRKKYRRRTPLFRRLIPKKYRPLPWPQAILATATDGRSLGLATSVVFHLGLFVFLCFLVFHQPRGRFGDPFTATFDDSDALTLVEQSGSQGETSDSVVLLDDAPIRTPVSATENLSTEARQQLLTDTLVSTETPLPTTNDRLPEPSSGGGMPIFHTGTTAGRTEQHRRQGFPGREGETTEASEAAVERGLAWLAAHQLPDGGWAFDLTARDENGRPGACDGTCRNSVATSGGGTYRQPLYPSRMAATGLALMPFFGAGYTHKNENPYRKEISSGLEYLHYRANVTPHGVDFREPMERRGMYTQAIVVLTLCEAFEMTRDPQIGSLAAAGVQFLEASQRDDGGWRYEAVSDPNFDPHIDGDTSVSGWVLMGLKSGLSAGFELRPETLYRTANFLDRVASDSDSLYRYQAHTSEPQDELHGTTAVGLLMREYLGWGPNQRGIKKGMTYLARWFRACDDDWTTIRRGRATDRPLFHDDRMIYNLYFVYYGMLAMHHVGGRDWAQAFPKTRELLIATQSDGSEVRHEAGSWLFYDRYLNDGGRLLNTVLSVLILETPYRYLPMYRQK